MTGSLSPRIPGLLTVAGAGLVAGLASGRPELVVLAAPLLLFAGVGLVLAEEPRLTANLSLDRTRVLEGEQVRIGVELRNEGSGAVELELDLVRNEAVALGPECPILLRVPRGGKSAIEFRARPLRWGAHAIGPLLTSARDPVGAATWTGRLGPRLRLRAFPREDPLRKLVAPGRTRPFLGSHVARARGEGIEFADIRRFAPGDWVRRVNWRATARHGELYVTERHPEHASDVVLLIDTFAQARAEPLGTPGTNGTLEAAVRAAASLARAHLARRDRVALVDFGGTLQWLEPAFGTTQLYRIVDALLSSEIAFSYAWRAVESIPRRVLPPGALVLAITPLLDERSIRLVTDLRTRGTDLTVIEVSPLSHVALGQTPSDALAHRLWRLQRDALRARLHALGIGVAVWNDDVELAETIEEVNAFRRSARHTLRV